MIFLGIDPGKKGAIARIINEDVSVERVPMVGKDYDICLMSHLIRRIVNNDTCFCVIERAQAMPKQGTVSMFEFGKGFGIWLGILASHGIPYQVVHARVWTKTMLAGAPGAGKERGILAAKQMFPSWNPKLKKDMEAADAVLLAAYAQRLHR